MKKNILGAIAALVLGTAAVSSCCEKKIDVNGEWKVTELNGAAVELTEVPSITLDNGKYNMFAGVNSAFGEYQYDGKTVVIGHGGMTKMMGAPEAMEVEHKVVALFGQTLTVAADGEDLVLSLDGAPAMRLTK